MKKLFTVIFFIHLLCNYAIAKNVEPLRIAVSNFAPPFVFQTSRNQLSGFDIHLMLHICKSINRPCKFIPMESSDVLASINNKTTDVGVGGINIANNKYQLINFSIPYMTNEYRILSNKLYQDFELNNKFLKSKIIGIEKQSLIKAELIKYARQNQIKTKEFSSVSNLISALYRGDINLAVVENTKAIYWQNNSSNKLYMLGAPLNFGIGIGIPIYSGDPKLIKSINAAILSYKSSNEYNQLYAIYFNNFT